MLRFSQNEKPQTNFHIFQNNIVSTIASTWDKKMHGYSFSRAKLEEKWKIRGTDYAQGNSYEDIFKMEATVFIILQTFFNAREKMFTNSLPFVAWDVHFSMFSGTILWTNRYVLSMFSSFGWGSIR